MAVTVLRWIGGGVAAVFAVGAIVSFVVYVVFENPVWLDRARRLRTWIWLIALFWFNTEVWGRVIHTLVTWGG